MKKKKGFKKEKKHVMFDEKERTEYLTGFHKRKLARKVKAKEKLEKLLKEEKKRIKQNQKEALEKALSAQNQVPEIEHLLKPITYDLPNHTVTISELQDLSTLPVTSALHITHEDASKPKKNEDEIEKVRKLIKDQKAKRLQVLKKSSVQQNAKRQQRKFDRAKAKRMQKLLMKSSKHTKKKHKKKNK